MTILFMEDWKRYPRASIHYETKNTSFIRLAEIYYHMGVQNNAFHLALHRPELRHIDPHNPDLSLELKAMVIEECKSNFWYFLREVARIPVPGSLVPISFKANRANIALYWYFFNHVMVLIVILRQTGKTTTLMTLVEYLLNFGSTNSLINLLTKSEGLKAETLANLKQLFEELPEYANFSTKKDIFNSDEVKLGKLNNKLKGNLSSSSQKQAEKVGRGFTAPINVVDEAAFVENIATAMGAMLMSGNAARTAAKLNNKPYGTILATTAGNTDDRDGKYVYQLANAATWHDEMFFDCKNLDDLMETIYKNSNAGKNQTKRPIVNITMSYRQLGYDDKWLEEKLAENISTPENIQRDLFNQWLSGSSQSPIPKEYIKILRDNIVEIPRSEFFAPYNYLLRWYISPEELESRINQNHHFIVGVDTSDGSGRDDISFVVRSHVDGKILCAATFNEINLITLADFFVSFLMKYLNATMIIERRSSAAAIIDYMIQKFVSLGVNPFTRLYNTIAQNKETNEELYTEIIRAKYFDIELFTKHKKHIGFVTSGTGVTARSELYSVTLMSMLKYTSYCTHDEPLVGQISGLIIKNNRIDHPDGGKDDMVIAALLSYWLPMNGKNLNSYGIDTTTLLRANKVYLDEKYSNADADFDEQEAFELEVQFNELLDEYKEENHPVLARQLELRIRKIAAELKTNTNVISVEEMLENINREKRINRVNR